MRKIHPIVTESFIRCKKLNISLGFITKSYFAMSKNVRLNSTTFIFKIPNKRELQQITIIFSGIDLEDFMNFYRKCIVKPYSFLFNNTPLASDDPLRFRDNLLERINKVIMTINDEIKDEQRQYNIFREAAKISTFIK